MENVLEEVKQEKPGRAEEQTVEGYGVMFLWLFHNSKWPHEFPEKKY